MNLKIEIPKRDTPEYEWWHKGATAQAEIERDGITEENRQLFNYVRVLAKQGRSADSIAEHTAFVFTSTWSRRRRLKLAWKLLRR